MRKTLTDEEVEKEIERLSSSPDVQLARAEMRMRYKRRQYLYTLRSLEKRGKELRKEGVTPDKVTEMELECEEPIEVLSESENL